MNFSLIVPTKNRHFFLKRFLNDIYEKSYDYQNIEIILCIDPSDQMTMEVEHPYLNLKKIVSREKHMASLNRIGISQSRGKYVFLLNDDIRIKTKNWDKLIVEKLDNCKDSVFLAYPNDLYNGKFYSTFPIISRKLLNLFLDELIPIQFEQHGIDYHLYDIFIKLKKMGYDRLVYFKNIHFEHLLMGETEAFFSFYGKRSSRHINMHHADKDKYLLFEKTRFNFSEKLVHLITNNIKISERAMIRLEKQESVSVT
ncbi:MAG: glycosyltransferase [Deltaproteobacteria bacterium]|nr:glycosyltransferase [Deltaproteobacteria bacterium]